MIGHAWKMFSVFVDAMNKCCPLKTVTVRRDKPPYITKEILDLGKERDKLFQQAVKSKLDIDWKLAKAQRQRVNYAVKNAKAYYIKFKLKTSKGDSRKFWNDIKILLPDKK